MPRPRLENPRRAVTVKLPPALIDRWEREAKRASVTKTAVLERALEAALGDPAADEGPVAVPANAVSPANAVAPVASPRALGEARAAAFRRAQRR